jgi:Rps23 Pro-64 3,4-dihydroxylase Tpa1-like proline 4-hydroxylase
MKRKAEKQTAPASNGKNKNKKQATESNAVEAQFGDGLFAQKTLKGYTDDYASSAPYKHAVVHGLMNDSLLRSVRTEIIDNIHFTPKETDIYKIHQSGDLANLSGLPESALEKLPSLLKLRNALYGPEFREWISTVAGSGPLSGKKTDMAVNVYVPGCHLLCHDDVIGSRRVSYILYLTDPDKPWQANWGGALRLYPTDDEKGEDGKTYKVPRAEFSKVIPPAWNQLSFFAVQPGESFHDVEEVYHRAEGVEEDDGGRVRMAISGWFHIPQEGEEGFEPGLEEKLAEQSSLQQLQGKGDQFDDPKPQWIDPEVNSKQPAATSNGDDDDEEEAELTEEDLQFLLNYMTPNYLTPDTVEELNEMFTEESTAQMANFLNKKLAPRLRKQLESESFKREFATSRPPHKHRYQYLASKTSVRPPPVGSEEDPHGDILYNFLPSLAFRKWLSVTTGLSLKRCAILARKFRRGLDYQLATGYRGEQPQLEYCLNVTPSPGWAPEEPEAGEDEDDEGDDDKEENGDAAPKSKGKGKAHAPAPEPESQPEQEEDNVGGYELYMAGDDDSDDEDSDNDDAHSDHGVNIPAKFQSATGAGDRRSAKKAARAKADPAIYKAAQEDEEDDGILFSNPASWNTLSLVLRDRGVLKFVKYVSGRAKGDRYDFAGAVEVEDDGDDEDEDEDAGEGAAN